MKNVKLMLLAITAILFLGMENISAQENFSQTVIIRVTETIRGTGDNFVTITDSKGKTSVTMLKKGFDISGENVVLVQKELDKWKYDGYKITHLSTAGASENGIFRTTIILEK